MTKNEAKLLKLGDYVKRCKKDQSDEYFLVTGINEEFKLRRVGDKKLIVTTDLEEFTRIPTD